jgi:GT2 family glycosyltransferase
VNDTVSVVICSKDRRADLAAAIASVQACQGVRAPSEIVVVEETDDPRAMAGVRYVPLPPASRGFGYARNVGLRAARGEMVVFLDDDCEAQPDWLTQLTAPLREDRELLGVAGAVLVRDCGAIGYAENILGFPGGGLRYVDASGGRVVPTRRLSTCNCAYRRAALVRAGGFPEAAKLGGEDFLLAERVAALGRCVFAPKAVAYHRPRGSLRAVFGWFARRGESELHLACAARRRVEFLAYLLRSSWTLRGTALLALVLAWPVLLAVLPFGALAYYGAILWRFRFARAYPSHRRAWPLVPLVKLTMDFGLEYGRWRALLRGRW